MMRLLLLIPLFSFSQVQIGSSITGISGNDWCGYSVDISGNGNKIAMGSIYYDGMTADNVGHVRIFNNNAGTWEQVGSAIEGQNAQDLSGSSISLSNNGGVVAIGAPFSDVNGTDSGQVRVFIFDGLDWSQLGNDINGEASNDRFGHSVSLSDNGNILAISGFRNNGDGIGNNTGHVRIFELIDGTTWTQIGSDLNGNAAEDQFGYSVSLSGNGNVVAIGSVNSGNVNFLKRGQVSVFERNSNTWISKGTPIQGEKADDQSGWSVSISKFGTVLAIGAPYNDDAGANSGHVKVYKFDTGAWIQVGSNINGEGVGDQSGWSVSLSDLGTKLAIGSQFNNGINGIKSGSVRIFENINDTWTKVGTDIDGDAVNDNFGYSTAISGNGVFVVAGSYNNDTSFNNAGQVKVFNITLNSLAIDEFVQTNFKLYPNPAAESLSIELGENIILEKALLYTVSGQLISTIKNNTFNVQGLSNGFYYIEIYTNKGKATKSIMLNK